MPWNNQAPLFPEESDWWDDADPDVGTAESGMIEPEEYSFRLQLKIKIVDRDLGVYPPPLAEPIIDDVRCWTYNSAAACASDYMICAIIAERLIGKTLAQAALVTDVEIAIDPRIQWLNPELAPFGIFVATACLDAMGHWAAKRSFGRKDLLPFSPITDILPDPIDLLRARLRRDSFQPKPPSVFVRIKNRLRRAFYGY